MIKAENIFDDIKPFVAMWVGDTNNDAGELARVANIAIDENISFVSMPPDATKTFWPWIEGKNIRILNRFNFSSEIKSDDFDVCVSELSVGVRAAFRGGANGAQIFVPHSELEQFVQAMQPIRNDLFFDRHLSIGIDIDEMSGVDWETVFDTVAKIKPDSVLIFGHVQEFNPKSDFVGRIYDMLEKWSLNTELHLMFGKNMLRVTQTLRLIQKMQPNLVKGLRVFVEK